MAQVLRSLFHLALGQVGLEVHRVEVLVRGGVAFVVRALDAGRVLEVDRCVEPRAIDSELHTREKVYGDDLI